MSDDRGTEGERGDALDLIVARLRDALPCCPPGVALVAHAADLSRDSSALRDRMRALIAILDRVGGFMADDDQRTLAEARRLLAR